MTNFFLGFLAGGLLIGGGIIALMYRDWQECKRLSKRITERLEAMDKADAGNVEG